jgi:TolB-like protein
MRPTLILLSALALLFTAAGAQTKFYNYYDEGLRFMEAKDWQRAIGEFRSATTMEFEDAARKRTYGTHFIEYMPHREMGRAFYYLGEKQSAQKELELSYAYVEDDDTKDLLRLVKGGAPLTKIDKPDVDRKPVDIPRPTLPVGALTYDPSRVTQVGTRLSLAVLPIVSKGEAERYGDIVTDKMVTQLVNLRRFKVIERTALEKILKEQEFQKSFMADEQTAVKAGKVAGADAIVIGTITVVGNATRVTARVIDTETGEAIVAKEEQVEGTDLADIEKTVEHLAIMIYNELPIVEGYVVAVEPQQFYVDVGSSKGIRKGSKCVVFREGDKIRHPVTGEILGSKVTKLGELVVTDVQDKMSTAKIVQMDQDFKVGDKIVVK